MASLPELMWQQHQRRQQMAELLARGGMDRPGASPMPTLHNAEGMPLADEWGAWLADQGINLGGFMVPPNSAPGLNANILRALPGLGAGLAVDDLSYADQGPEMGLTALGGVGAVADIPALWPFGRAGAQAVRNVSVDDIWRFLADEAGSGPNPFDAVRLGSGLEYPMAPRDLWYGDANFESTGGRMTTMTPQEFLERARPLELDDVARDNIDDLKRHIESGGKLDPLAFWANGREDGRHRAYAAIELGIQEVPVLVWDGGAVDDVGRAAGKVLGKVAPGGSVRSAEAAAPARQGLLTNGGALSNAPTGPLVNTSVADAADDFASRLRGLYPDATVNVKTGGSAAGQSSYVEVTFPGMRPVEVRVSDHSLGPARFNDYVGHLQPGADPTAALDNLAVTAKASAELASRNADIVSRILSAPADVLAAIRQLPGDAGRARKLLREAGIDLRGVDDAVLRRQLKRALSGDVSMSVDDVGKAAGNVVEGITAYQGSPHTFAAERLVRMPDGTERYLVGEVDRLPDVPQGATVLQDFPLGRQRLDKIGTGEGAQAYGRGLYFAENEGLARWYRDNLSRHMRPSNITDAAHDTAQYYLREAGGDGERAAQALIAYAGETAETKPILDYLRNPPGSMYQVRINANPDDFLDWDKPLSEQSERVRSALDELPYGDLVRQWSAANPTAPLGRLVGDAASQHALRSGNAAATAGTYDYGPRTSASDMRSQGVPGIKYLDAGSRGAGDGTRNYVVFDDKLIEILRRYGLLPPLALGAGAALSGGEAEAGQ